MVTDDMRVTGHFFGMCSLQPALIVFCWASVVHASSRVTRCQHIIEYWKLFSAIHILYATIDNNELLEKANEWGSLRLFVVVQHHLMLQLTVVTHLGFYRGILLIVAVFPAFGRGVPGAASVSASPDASPRAERHAVRPAARCRAASSRGPRLCPVPAQRGLASRRPAGSSEGMR